MTDLQLGNPSSDIVRFNPRAFLAKEWPYLLVLLFAFFGIAYSSVSKRPMTLYWIILAPFIGLICVTSEAPRRSARAACSRRAGQMRRVESSDFV
jgi:hypothetical protein